MSQDLTRIQIFVLFLNVKTGVARFPLSTTFFQRKKRKSVVKGTLFCSSADPRTTPPRTL